ncbi:MAG: secretin and TonB N-terminal domain-containing protein [Deltaproteobacteria bacterium]|nr:secretin and TonB N-terminal domain-containing protein [Deltaproteobacteria bacterium]MBI3076033.1 secretin and TonB N-terminal domain-containing protein [Deltaproteobacteria bacterium]
MRSCQRRLFYWGLVSLLTLGGCASAPAPRERVVSPRTATPPPPPAPAREMPVFQIEEQRRRPEQLYSLTLREADLREVILALAEKTRLNIILDPDVKGQVTVDLKEVTLEEALRALLTPLNFESRREGSFIRISLPRPETRIFTLNYIVSPRTGSRSTSVSTGATTTGVTGVTGVTGAAGAAGGGGGGSTVSSSDAFDLWGEIEKGLGSLKSPQGSIHINRLAGTIVATDLLRNLNRIAEFLEAVEGSVQRQVTIEANIIEVNLFEEYRFGLNWSTLADIMSIPFGTASGGGIFQLRVTSGMQILLDLLSRQGKVNVLSSPKVAVLNNQKAVIRVAREDIFFKTTVTAPTISGGVVTPGTTTFTPQSITVGIVLDVTPQIGPDGTVLLNIRPSISDRVGEARAPDGSSVPIIAVRETDTVVRVREGETIVLGGLIQDRRRDERTGVPGLSDLPLVGGLFGSTTREQQKTELVILLTPHVTVGRRVSQAPEVPGGSRAIGRP